MAKKKGSKKKASKKSKAAEPETIADEQAETEVSAEEPDQNGYETAEDTGEVVELPPSNPYNVPVDSWEGWSEEQQGRFKAVYEAMMQGPSSFNSHPEAERIDTDQWRVIAWNAAFAAASA